MPLTMGLDDTNITHIIVRDGEKYCGKCGEVFTYSHQCGRTVPLEIIFTDHSLECMNKISTLEASRVIRYDSIESYMRDIEHYQKKVLELTAKVGEQKALLYDFERQLLELKAALVESLQPLPPSLPFDDPNQKSLEEDIGRAE